MKKLIVVSVFLTSSLLLGAASVIDSAGTFTPFVRCKIEVQQPDVGSLKYTISCAWKTLWVAIGPDKPTQVHGRWFLFPESDTRVWFYDGEESLILYQIGYFGGGSYEVGRTGPWLLDQIPEGVAVLLSQKLVDKIEAAKKTPNQSPEPTTSGRGSP